MSNSKRVTLVFFNKWGHKGLTPEMEKKLGALMKDNQSSHCSIGSKIICWHCNTQLHHTIKKSPYHVTFGQLPCCKISNLPIAPELLDTLHTEDELLKVLGVHDDEHLDNEPPILAGGKADDDANIPSD